MKFILFTITTLIVFFAQQIHAREVRKGVFKCTSFSSATIDTEALRAGISQILKNQSQCRASGYCNDMALEATLLQKALQFRKNLQEVTRQSLARYKDQEIPFKDRWEEDFFGALEYHEIRFPSLLQRPGDHPSNQVIVKYVVPKAPSGCPIDFKTTLILPGSTEKSVEDIFSMNANLVILKNMATMVLIFPNFGKRRFLPNGHLDIPDSHTKYDPKEHNMDFLTVEDLSLSELNVTQTILDIHLLLDWIHDQHKAVKYDPYRPATVSLMGFSLGGAMGLLYEGLEPGRITGGNAFYAAGGDFAGVVSATLLDPEHVDDYFTKRVRVLNYNDDVGRMGLGFMEHLVWAGQIKHREFMLLSADNDRTFIPEKSYTPLLRILDEENDLELLSIPTEHNPTRSKGMLYLAANLFLPMADYLSLHGYTSDPWHCGPVRR